MGWKKNLLVALVCFAAVSSSQAGSVEHTGQWWRVQPVTAKYQYAAGLFDDRTVGSNLLAFGMSAQVMVTSGTTAPYNSGEQRFVRFNGGELVEALDKFYADPRNVNIPVSKASLVFVHSVDGEPRAVLVKMIEEFRKPGC